MAKTDGYITDKTDGDWRYSNTGQGSRGDVTGVLGRAYLRIQRGTASGDFTGTKVDSEGVVSDGPIVSFDSLNSLLDGAPAETGLRPSIVWAGISPTSLSEALIVWNQPIVLLDQTKIDGGTGVISVAGRVMIVQLSTPVSIDGEEQKTIKIAPGAVGIYIAAVRQGEITKDCVAASNTTVNTPSGSVTPFDPPENVCGDEDPIVGGGLGDQAGGASSNVLNATIFAEQLCQTPNDCDPALEQPNLGFVVNNGMSFPVYCCHPFMLQALFNNAGSDCNVSLPGYCPVWMASLYIFGSTCPLEVLSVDQLVDIPDDKLCNFNSLFDSGVISGALHDDANCCSPCTIEIVGNAGPQVLIDGEWRGEIPGVAGQPAFLSYLNTTSCSGEDCQSVISSESPADTWTEEGILKSRPRTLPVQPFDPMLLASATITATQMITTEIDLLTSCPTVNLDIITSFNLETITGVTLESENPALLTAFSQVEIADVYAWDITAPPIIVPDTFVVQDSTGSETFLVSGTTVINEIPHETPANAKWLITYGQAVIQMCVDGEFSNVTVITSISTQDIETTEATVIMDLSPVSFLDYRVFSTDSTDPHLKHLVSATSDDLALFTSFGMHVFTNVPDNVHTANYDFVTECQTQADQLHIMIPDPDNPDPDIFTDVLYLDPTNFSIVVPTVTNRTDPCGAAYKVVMQDDVLKWTSIFTDFSVACNPSQCNSTPEALRHCIAIELPMANESGCANVNLLSAVYVSHSETSDVSCMGYDCSPEGPITPPQGSDAPNGPGGPVECGILIRRPRRRFFLKCQG